MRPMLIDTNVFIDFLKGNIHVKTFFNKEQYLTTSIICVMEVIAGLSTKREIKSFENFLRSAMINIYFIDERISKKAYEFFINYYKSMGVGIADVFIAATAILNREKLVTFNTKHFSGIKDISVLKPY